METQVAKNGEMQKCSKQAFETYLYSVSQPFRKHMNVIQCSPSHTTLHQ